MKSLLAGAAFAVCCTLATAASADVTACLEAAERAQPLRAAGKLIEARKNLLTCAAPACPKAVVSDCARWLADTDDALPSLVFQARNAAGQDVVDVRVSMDGVLLATNVDGAPITVDPGVHRIRFEKVGYGALEQSVVVRQGEHRRVVSSLLAPDPPAPSSVPTRSAAVEAATPQPRAVPTGAWVLAGAGAALAATAAGLWIDGKHTHDQLSRSCAPSGVCDHGDVVAARRELIAGDILMGCGLIAIGVGVVLTTTSLRRGPAPAIAIAVAPGSFVATGTF